MSLRVGIGGVHIECSTFTPILTTIDDFAVRRGKELLDRYAFTRDRTVEWVPLVHARAVPGGPVHPDTYRALKEELVERLRAAGRLDGLVFDIHGAMHVPGFDDVETDLAAAVRAATGPHCLISTATDLHGSVTEALVREVDLITAHRLAPHEDEWETRERAARVLSHCLRQGIRPVRAWVRVPVLLPGEKTSTRVEPARGLWGGLADVERVPGVLDAAIWVGYAWADEPRSAAAVVVSGTDEATVAAQAGALAQRYWAARDAFAFVGPTGTAEEALAAAVAAPERPFVISDSGDNPTAGGAGDVPYLLARLLDHPAFASGDRTAIFASITDPDTVRACAAAGVGAEVDVAVGGRLDPRHGGPVRVGGRVDAVVDDETGGLVAVLASGGVRVIVTSRRRPYHLMADYAKLGLDPERADLVVVKIGYLEPELQRLARGWMIALTPGGVDQDLIRLDHRRLTRPLHPFDPDMPTPTLTPSLLPSR
jgi:microcystin degradation protein MlrC